MSQDSPYHPPESHITHSFKADFAEINLFSASQRIGRVRFLAYSFIANIVFLIATAFILGFSYALFNGGKDLNLATTGVVSIAIYIVPIVIGMILAIRRLHDLNNSGWLSLLYLIPVVNFAFALYLLFAPGTKGQNEYGMQPKPNTVLTWIAGLIAPVFIIGMLAAIAIPAYNDYAARAKAAQTQPQD